ncbi:MAG: DNA methyltransferase [Pseudomonadota bacterium]
MTKIENLAIGSPKRARGHGDGWEGFFPYYAGFPAEFAKNLISSAELGRDDVILDPWNGSGTTSYAAALCGRSAIGIDINPVMVIVARARLLGSSEADTLVPLGQRVLYEARANRQIDKSDPLLTWFRPLTAAILRGIERSIRAHLVGALTITPKGARLDHLSGLAATNYVALFSVARSLAQGFRTSNPTWLRKPKAGEARVGANASEIEALFEQRLRSMSAALTLAETGHWRNDAEIRLGDSTSAIISGGRADLVLTSPPYCTRIDYTSATRIELALLQPLQTHNTDSLRRKMAGSPLVPLEAISERAEWGRTCLSFLESVREHRSRASSGYYYKTHVDYFDKIYRSLGRVSSALSHSGVAVLVAQDSFYKEIRNDLSTILSEMSERQGMALERREDFAVRTMASINPGSIKYRSESKAFESVLCFRKVRGDN